MTNHDHVIDPERRVPVVGEVDVLVAGGGRRGRDRGQAEPRASR